MERRCISVDWLTMYCESSMIVQNKRWEWRKLDHGSAQFSEVYKVYDREKSEQYCIVQRCPYSPIIPKRAVMVQVCNRFLYYNNWNNELNNFLLASNIKPISISRIDIACDFTEFAYGVSPQSFIKKAASGQYRYAGRSKITYTTKAGSASDFEYMRIGDRESEISSYLYNKTQELKDVQDKPYIREMWERSGLDTSKNVWRLEVSLSNVQMRTVIKETGEVFRLDLDFFKTQGIVENVFNCACLKSFKFKYNKPGERTTRLRDVLLFNHQSTTLLMTIPTNDAKTNRMDKIIIKRLANYHSMYRIEDKEEIEILQKALSVLLKNEALADYYYEKVVPLIGWYKER